MSASELLTDSEKLLDLCGSLHDQNGTSLQAKVNSFLQEQTGAKLVFMVPLLAQSREALVQVVGDTVLNHERRFPVDFETLNATSQNVGPLGSGIKGNEDLEKILHCVVTQCKMTPFPQTYLHVAIIHPQTKEIAMFVFVVDYENSEDAVQLCTRRVQECLRVCLGTISNGLAYDEEKRLKIQCKELLQVARNLFLHLGDITELLQEIMAEARRLTNAERCSLFLLDPDHHDLVAKVFDGQTSDEMKEVRIAPGQGIAGHVANSGELLNIRDAYQHPLFFKGMDETTGYITRNILCFPIRDENGVVGVAELCNKIGGYHFDVFDEEVATAFSIYCGISIMHSLVYKRIQNSQARNKLSNELMIYHMKVSDQDVEKVIRCENNHVQPFISDFSFAPRNLPLEETPCFILWMMEDLDLVKKFNIRVDTLARFTLYVQKGYRDTPYHNWMHAFSMTHSGYMLIKNLRLVEEQMITDLECLAFIVSCICHDVDHRGTNNSFQMQSGNALASLYSSEGSVMERHHLAQAMCILNTEGCNIFDSLPRDVYTQCLDLMREMILATDLAHHFRVFEEQKTMATRGYDRNNASERNLLLCHLMTVCDLSDQTKDYATSKATAEMLYREFFTQGDLEKSMGKMPVDMMDRDKARIPQLQLQFLSDVVLPLYEVLVELFPESYYLLRAVEANRDQWAFATKVIVNRQESSEQEQEVPDLDTD